MEVIQLVKSVAVGTVAATQPNKASANHNILVRSANVLQVVA
jgi:hypothetical protein